MNSRFPHNPLRLGLYAQTVSVIVGRGLAPIDGNLRGKKEYPYLLKMC